MKVIILTEGSNEKGFGHIARCSSIYQALNQRNIPVEFIINGDLTVEPILQGMNYSLLNWLSANLDLKETDIVIVDSYLATQEFYQDLAKKVGLLISIDDNNRLSYAEGMVVNGTIFAEDLDYPINQNIHYLLGSKYIPLRYEFWDSKTVEINQNIKTILITMGGNDLRNLTPKILQKIDEKFPKLNKKVIIGNSFKNKKEIESINCKNTELIYSPDASGMLDAMLNSDLAISASGQTLYELARVGLPTIAIGVIENQINNIENWQKQEFIEFAGFWDESEVFDNIMNKIKILQNFDLRKIKQNNGTHAVDGKGALRIAKIALSDYFSKKAILREANLGDCLKIYQIANDSEVRKSSFNTEEIKLENHKIWFRNILKNDLVTFLVLEYLDDIIGQLRFDFDEDMPVISISLNKKYRGLGLSKILLKKSLTYVENYEKVYAYIKKDNYKSISFFKSMGFELISEDEKSFKYCYKVK